MLHLKTCGSASPPQGDAEDHQGHADGRGVKAARAQTPPKPHGPYAEKMECGDCSKSRAQPRGSPGRRHMDAPGRNDKVQSASLVCTGEARPVRRHSHSVDRGRSWPASAAVVDESGKEVKFFWLSAAGL